jgi:transcriptional regulator with XRE-family HTH domain
MPSYNVNQYIKKLRGRKGLSAQMVARQSGHSVTTLSRIENERQTPTPDVFQSLLTGMDMPADALKITIRGFDEQKKETIVTMKR